MSDRAKQPARVSVVIPCFNYGRHLTEAVESVLAQTFDDIEIVIVDDGSTDDSPAVAEAIIAQHPSRPIRLLRQENSGSPGHTRNVGIGASHGEYVLCLDADDVLDPAFLQACVDALDSHPHAAVAYGDVHYFGDDTRVNVPPPWDARTELQCNFVTIASVFRRRAWEQVGGFDTEIGYEDWDFWIGCIEQGWSGVKAPGAKWYYRAHAGGVYCSHVVADQETKAKIVLKHPDLYGDEQREWAAGVLAGDPDALRTGTRVGAIPSYIPRRAPAAKGARAKLPIRSICLITKDYPPSVPGGIPRAVQMQAHMLAAAGVEVHVITKSESGVSRRREDRGVVVHELPEPRIAVPPALSYLELATWSFVAAAKYAELDASVSFDVVEAPDYRAEALHLAPRPETALVVWLHSTMKVVWEIEPGYAPNPHDHAWHSLEMAALERADLLLAPSQLLLDTTARYLGDRMRPAQLMPYLFDSMQFPCRRQPSADGRVRVLFYGRLEARKNPELALRAVARARAEGLDVELRLVGRNNGGHCERVLHPLQRELGLHDIEYVPHTDIDGLRSILAGTDVAILPSRFDNSPLTIFEALSSGVPVITSDRVGTCSWIEPENGLLALPIADEEEFARLAATAMADPGWMATGPRAAARIRQKFAPEAVTDQLLECYGKLMAVRDRPLYEPATDLAAAAAQLAEGAEALARVATPRATDQIEGARSHAVLAFADELVEDPVLLAAWATAFTSTDDMTLVIYAPGWTGEDAERRLVPAVEQAGLHSADAADLIALVTPPTAELEQRLASGCMAMLTHRREWQAPFATLRAAGAADLLRLRCETPVG